ncbi:hypothetical protein FF100_23380 [Methylobacterium terricola]|uniref:Dolichyl-phosphate-mannose-protein mannosyltransferase n=1 Tax=Methylobacterium terricola TaxID=2583531 RepID=A0A5C4LE44_9HYPH|nr:hypothetical protein [Methylobacterium terricola]TNC10229.1 hypothetical protein FF100_23380 [Methylobacterium terricola]
MTAATRDASSRSDLPARSPSASARQRLADYGATVLTALLLLGPALANGFPFVFADTGTYLLSGAHLSAPWDRPIFYGLFTTLFRPLGSPWPVVAVQALAVAILLRLFLRALLGVTGPGAILVAGIVLAGATGLPWFAGQLVPDVFSACLILALLLLVLAWERMARLARSVALATVTGSVSVHYGNLPLAASALPATALLVLFGWRPAGGLRRLVAPLLALGLAIGLGAAALVSVNLAARRGPVLSASSATFLLARLLDDGPALQVLETECPSAGYRLCGQLDRLRAYRDLGDARPNGVPVSDFFLWDGPLADLGWWAPTEPEAREVVRKALRIDPLGQVGTTLINGLRQTWRVAIGDGLAPYPADTQAVRAVREVYGRSGADSFAASSQMQGLDLRLPNAIQAVMLPLSILVLATGALARWPGRRRVLPLVVLLALLLAANAVVTGGLSAVHDRYQARVVWLLVLAATGTGLLAWQQARTRRGETEPG